MNTKLLFALILMVPLMFSCGSTKKTSETNTEQAIVTDTIIEVEEIAITENEIEVDDVVIADTITEMETVVELEPVVEGPATFIDSIITQYGDMLGDCEQLLVVYNTKASSIVSRLEAYELTDGRWVAVDSLNMPANVGKRGFASHGKKAEGDGKSPTGIYSITHFFSKYPKFDAKLQKIKITKNSIWVDDSKDPLYNSFYEQNEQNPKKGENLYRSKDALYDYVMVINYNTEERKPYKGSAIFLHVWSRPGGPTAGCVAVEKQNILRLFGWIDEAKHPKIVMGSRENGEIFNIIEAYK